MNISNSARKILNDQRLIDHRNMWMSRLQNLFDNTPDEYNDRNIIGVSGNGIWPSPLLLENPELWVREALENLAEAAEKSYDENNCRVLSVECGILGVHFMDKIFGAEVIYQDDQWYNSYLTTEIGELQKPNLDKCEVWQIAKRAAMEFIRQDVKLPLFGLPTIASALVTSVNLYGDGILMAMLAEPEAAAHDLSIINDVLCHIHNWFRSVLPPDQLHPVIAFERTQPPGYGQICGCTCQLISAETYATLIAPLDNALLGCYPKGGMMHLCGAHEQHIPAFRDMKNLNSIQINDRACMDLEKYYHGLRSDQIIYFMPYEDMSIEQALEITGGNKLVIQKPPQYSVAKP